LVLHPVLAYGDQKQPATSAKATVAKARSLRSPPSYYDARVLRGDEIIFFDP